MIRIGILGAAKIAPLAMLQPVSRRTDCTVVSIASRDMDRARLFAKAHNIPDVDTSYDSLLQRNDIDLIYNALPPHRHADLSIAALRAGKAVLCEKPFAMNADEAAEMVAVARQTGRPLLEAFHYRYHPAFIHVLNIVQSRELGRPLSIDAHFSVPIPYVQGELRHTLAVGGGALMDLGCYPLHWARTLISGTPRVEAAKTVCEHVGIDLEMFAELVFPNDVTGKITCSMARGAPTAASIHFRAEGGELHVMNPIAPHMGHEITTIRNETSTKETIDGQTTYDHQLAHVIRILSSDMPPLTGGDDAIENMSVIDEIYRKAGLFPRGMQDT